MFSRYAWNALEKLCDSGVEEWQTCFSQSRLRHVATGTISWIDRVLSSSASATEQVHQWKPFTPFWSMSSSSLLALYTS